MAFMVHGLADDDGDGDDGDWEDNDEQRKILGICNCPLDSNTFDSNES